MMLRWFRRRKPRPMSLTVDIDSFGLTYASTADRALGNAGVRVGDVFEVVSIVHISESGNEDD